MTNRDPENLLLVEGHDDQHLVSHFSEKKLGDKLICAFRNKKRNVIMITISQCSMCDSVAAVIE